jgi:anti-sigma28 factor (negative regulator of flagellin synthesis)
MAADLRKKPGKRKLTLRLDQLREELRQGTYEVDALRLIEALARSGGTKPN